MNRLLLIVRVRIVVSVSAVVTLMALLSPGQASAETGYTVPFYASWSITCNYGEICLGQTHQGIDYSVGNNLAGGEVIAAAAAGSAKYCTDVYPWGKSVVIRHDTTNRTLYLHLSNWARGEGSTADVARGEIIGYEGSTGYSTGPHLHFEVRPNASNFLCPYEGLNGTPSDPANYWQDNPPNHADFSPAIASWVSTRVDMFVQA